MMRRSATLRTAVASLSLAAPLMLAPPVAAQDQGGQAARRVRGVTRHYWLIFA